MYRIILLILALIFSTSALAESKTGIQALYSSPETLIFIGIILALTYYFAVHRFNRFAVTQGPEILTTVGILGCFLGIAFALLNFNSADLSDSIPLLLEGIKTAFWASVFGVSGALAVKFRHLLRKDPIPQSDGAPKSATIDDLVAAMQALQKGLVGDEEGTLLTQMKLQRQESSDQLNKLRNAFNDFAKHMVENNQKAIIEALKQVISDFNKNLTEQFGENFKQLNQGVEHLVTWQQQYKEELDSLKQVQQQTAVDMRVASDAFTSVVKKSEEFAAVAENLKILLEAMDKQNDILFTQEKAMSELLIQMKEITPQFANKMSAMLTEITTGIKQVQSETREVVKSFGEQVKLANDDMKNLLTDGINQSQQQISNTLSTVFSEMNTGVKKVQSETVEVVKNFGSQAQSANAEMKNLLTDVINKSQQQLSEGLQENSKIIKEGVLTLDKALQKELNDSLTSLGKQLASLSEKFVEDYLPLTERLREVVRLAASVQR